MNPDLLERIWLHRGGGGGDENRGRRSPPDLSASRCKRALFGPPDHEANRRFVEQELARGQREMSDRYNFDFVTEQPLEGRWQWLPLNSRTVVDKENVDVSTTSSTTTTTATTSSTPATSDRTEQKASSLVSVSNTSPSVPPPLATVTAPATISSSSCDIPRTTNSFRSSSSSSSSSSQKLSAAASSRHSNRKMTGALLFYLSINMYLSGPFKIAAEFAVDCVPIETFFTLSENSVLVQNLWGTTPT